MLNIFYQNIHSIRGRIDDFNSRLHLLDSYDIIVLSETWLDESINDSELQLQNYDIFRCDRSILTSSKKTGGGVLIAVKKSLKGSFVPLIDSSYEQVLVQIKTKVNTILISAVYIPPLSSDEYYKGFVDNIQNSIVNFMNSVSICDLFIIGDHNLPGYQWVRNGSHSTAVGFHQNRDIRIGAESISDLCSIYSLIQYCPFNNVAGNILDLVFSNVSGVKVIVADEAIFDCDISHYPLNITANVSYIKKLKTSNYIYDFKNADYDSIVNELDGLSWQAFDSTSSDVDYLTNVFNNNLNLIVEKYVPKILIKSSNFPKWFSRELINSIKKKKKYHTLYKLYNSPYYYGIFSTERAKCNILHERDSNNYTRKVESMVNTDSKNFFNYVNTISKTRDYPSIMHYGDLSADNGSDIVNLFARKFGSVYTNLDLSNTEITYSNNDNICSLVFSKDDVLNVITRLNLTSGPGPDNLHPLLISKCADYLVSKLVILYNLSIKTGKFPDCWKLSYIKPLLKKGDVSDVNNYRPICKPSVVAKIFDQLVYDKLSCYLHKFIIPNQHGFMNNRSTITNLSVYTEDLIDSINKSCAVDAVYTDFSRAFDVVNTDLLIRKLNAYGINGDLLLWFKSYLTNRKQRVKIDSHLSEDIHVTSGVGQGSHLGPLLFLVFINDIGDYIKFCKFLLFADDLKAYRVINSIFDRYMIQTDLNSMSLWSNLNGIPFNIEKCLSITFGRTLVDDIDYSINSTKLEKVTSIKDLGIIFDKKLSFNNHIDHIKNIAVKRINFLKRFTRKFTSPTTFRTLYYSLLYPILTHGSVIWNPYLSYQSDILEKLNHKYLRYVAYKIGNPMRFNDHNYKVISNKMCIPSLESARNRIDLIFAFNIININIDCPYLLSKFNFHVPSRNFRNNNLIFYIKVARNDITNHSPVYRLSKLCNVNSDWFDIFHSSLNYVRNKSKVLFVYE